MIGIEVRLDVDAFVRSLHDAEDKVKFTAKQTLGQAVAYGVEFAKATTKFKDRKGALRKSIGRVPKGEWGWKLRATAKHARYIESGTKDSPKRIVAGGRALRFVWHGTVFFRKSVKHKGIKPTHFLRDAAQEVERVIDERMERNIANALR